MKFWLKLLICFFFALVLLFYDHLPAEGRQPPPNWRQITSSAAHIIYTHPDSQTAVVVQQYLQAALTPLLTSLRFILSQPVKIYICPNPATYNDFVGNKIPEWGEAVTFSRSNTIVLKSPYWSESRRTFKATVIHELVHVILAQFMEQQPIPTWLNEGLAVYFSGERQLASSSLVGKALTTNSLIPLNNINHVLQFQRDKALLAYQESFLAVNYLIEHFGKTSLVTLLESLKNNASLDNAFRTATQLTFQEFEQKWREHLQHENRWDVLIDLPVFLWILMGILFLIAVVLVFYRNRKKLKQWEAEEME